MITAPAEYETDDLFRGKSMFLDKVGAFHASFVKHTEMPDQNYVEMEFEVVGPQENGKRIDTRIYTHTQEGQPAFAPLIGIAINLGLLTIQQYEAAKANRQMVNLDFDQASGRQCIIDVKPRAYTDKKTGQERQGVQLWPDGIKHIDDKQYELVPLNMELAAMAGAKRALGNDPFGNPGPPAASQGATTAHPHQPQPQTTAQQFAPQQQQPVNGGGYYQSPSQQGQQPQPMQSAGSIYDDV